MSETQPLLGRGSGGVGATFGTSGNAQLLPPQGAPGVAQEPAAKEGKVIDYQSALETHDPHSSLRQRREVFRKLVAEDGNYAVEITESLSYYDRARAAFRGIKDVNPILNDTLTKVNAEFGSGISSLFYDWRWLAMCNLTIFVWWALLVLLPWFESPPRFAHSSPPYSNFWHRDDLHFAEFVTLLTGAKNLQSNSTFVEDSFMYYSGYMEKVALQGYGLETGSSEFKPYLMGPAWVAASLLSVLSLAYLINDRLKVALVLRTVDPDVQDIVGRKTLELGKFLAQKGLKVNPNARNEAVLGMRAQEFLLGGFDHSATTEKGARGSVTAVIVSLEQLNSTSYDGFCVPAHLSIQLAPLDSPIGPTFECFVRPGTPELSSLMQYRMAKGALKVDPTAAAGGDMDMDMDMKDVCPFEEVHLRCGEHESNASRRVTPKEARDAFQAYCVVHPEAKAACDKTGLLGEADPEQSLLKCILMYGDLSKTEAGGEARMRLQKGEWAGNPEWNSSDAVLRSRAAVRSAFVVGLPHGSHVSMENQAWHWFGLTLTLGFFAFSAQGVYMCTNHQAWIHQHFGPYAVTILLVLIKSVIPVVVKEIVKIEGWSSEELVMQCTLGRVYVLKMANLVVLLHALDKMADQDAGGARCVSLDIGLFLYQQVVVGSIMSGMSNFISWWAFLKIFGEKQEFDNQSVALMYIEINYQAALCWVGFSYCPLLPLVMAVLTLFEIPWNAFIIRNYCKCAEKPFQASAESRILVMLIFLTTFCYSCFPIMQFLYAHPSVRHIMVDGQLIPSYCGPIPATERRLYVLRDFLFSSAPAVKDVMVYLTNPMVLAGAICILLLFLSYERAGRIAVEEEAADQYLNLSNQQQHLRERRFQGLWLTRQKAALESENRELAVKLAALEAGRPAGGPVSNWDGPPQAGQGQGPAAAQLQRQGGAFSCFGGAANRDSV